MTLNLARFVDTPSKKRYLVCTLILVFLVSNCAVTRMHWAGLMGKNITFVEALLYWDSSGLAEQWAKRTPWDYY